MFTCLGVVGVSYGNFGAYGRIKSRKNVERLTIKNCFSFSFLTRTFRLGSAGGRPVDVDYDLLRRLVFSDHKS